MLRSFCNLLDRIIGAIAFLATLAAGVILVGMTGLIITEIFLRNVLQTSTGYSEEFVSYGLASIIFLAFAAAMREGSLIRVDLVISRLPTGARWGTEIALVTVTLCTMLFLTWFIWGSLARYWKTGAVSWSVAAIPLWIPHSVALFGIAIFCAALLVYLLRLILGEDVMRENQSSLD